jgi:hypothetical protein
MFVFAQPSDTKARDRSRCDELQRICHTRVLSQVDRNAIQCPTHLVDREPIVVTFAAIPAALQRLESHCCSRDRNAQTCADECSGDGTNRPRTTWN